MVLDPKMIVLLSVMCLLHFSLQFSEVYSSAALYKIGHLVVVRNVTYQGSVSRVY